MLQLPLSLLLLLLPLISTTKNINSTEWDEESYVMCIDSPDHWYSYHEKEGTTVYCSREVARAVYSNLINNTGWAFVEVEIAGDADLTLKEQGYAAGYLEGRASRHLISLYIRNMLDDYCNDAEDYCSRLYTYLEDNYRFTRHQIRNNPFDPYWQQVDLTMSQVRGMMDGFERRMKAKRRTKEIVRHPVYLIQLFGDLLDLEQKFNKPRPSGGVRKGRDHCSALVKVLPDQSDILFSHVTWTTYSSMLRMQKKYSFEGAGPGGNYSFSGYPGSVASIDDFVVTSSRLAILETTIENHNQKLWAEIPTAGLLCFVRSQIAHRMASSGREWAEIFEKHNSGTYNNQWVVLDYKKFRRGMRKGERGLLHVLEQMPGTVIHADQSSRLLEQTYWPGYNRPFYPQIFDISGSYSMSEKHGHWYSYDNAPRGLIFARDHSKVEGIHSMQRLMRSNDFTRDPLSKCDCDPPFSAESAISARSELNSPSGSYPIEDLGFMDQGATDMKVTNSHLIDHLSFYAVAGPPYGPLPVFDWDTSILRDTVPHHGQPTRWTFDTIIHNWSINGLF